MSDEGFDAIVSHPVMHDHFALLKKTMWDAFFEKDYEKSAKMSALILQNSGALDAVHVAGLSLTQLDRQEEGFEWCCASLSLAKGGADWFANASFAFLEKKDFLHAMLFAQNGLKEHPGNVRLTYFSGLCMCHAQDWDKAIAYFDETLKLDPDFYHATMSKGYCKHMSGAYDEAIELYKSITNIEKISPPDREEVVNNHACVLLEQAEPEACLKLLDTEYPNATRPGTQYNRSFILLGMGQWPEAWDLYRYRATVQVSGDQGMPSVPQPVAKTLDDIRGKNLFLFHEQGLGDSLQFIRYARLLRPYVSAMTIGVPKTMRRVAENLIIDQEFSVVADAALDSDKEIFTKCDVALPFIDGTVLLSTTVDTIPGEVPYFRVPEQMIEQRRIEFYNPSMNRKPKIGVCWAGSSRPDNIRAHSIDKRRSIPFEMMEPLLELPQYNFVSLQMPDNRVAHPTMMQPLNEDFDVLDTCAIIKQLDLVVTIDSSVAHMAASLNVPTWMLSRYDGCWRWFFDGRETSPWYPSLRIFQQRAHYTWPAVLLRVEKELRRWARGWVEEASTFTV